MLVSILIGFEYTTDILPATSGDLNIMHNWCRKFCDHVYTLTDIVIDENCGIRDTDLHERHNIVPVNDGESLHDELRRIMEQHRCDRLILYYSGHGVSESLILPNNTVLPFITLRNYICRYTDISTEIFCILDCCNSSGMMLPYELCNNHFMLRRYGDIKFTEHKILLLASCRQDEKSVATDHGSLFSKWFIEYMTELNRPFRLRPGNVYLPPHANRNLENLAGKIRGQMYRLRSGYHQTISIYGSQIMDPLLWLWIGRKNRRSQLTIAPSQNFFVFTNPNKSYRHQQNSNNNDTVISIQNTNHIPPEITRMTIVAAAN